MFYTVDSHISSSVVQKRIHCCLSPEHFQYSVSLFMKNLLNQNSSTVTCFKKATKRTRHNFTLYLYGLSCYVANTCRGTSKQVFRKRSEIKEKGAAETIKRDEITTFPPSAHLMSTLDMRWN
jgi:hypothetical protein